LALYTVDPKRQKASNLEPGTPLYRKFMENKGK